MSFPVPEGQPTPLLHASGLGCDRGGRALFRQLQLEVAAGQWLHVRGANGAGKTSLLRQLAGLAPMREGRILWRGRDIGRDGDDFRADTLYLGHRNGLKDDLSALENLTYASALDGHPASPQQLMQALHDAGLRGRAELPLRVLSQGQRRRALLARLLLRPSRLWILDEPLTALDSAAVDWLAQRLRTHLEAGGCAVLTSHQALPLAASQEVWL